MESVGVQNVRAGVQKRKGARDIRRYRRRPDASHLREVSITKMYQPLSPILSFSGSAVHYSLKGCESFQMSDERAKTMFIFALA